jgi:2'-5' RNA ligase
MEQEPLILTLSLDPEAQTYFNGLRKAHFPADRNYLDAHLTLFHHLTVPHPELAETLLQVSQPQTAFSLHVTELMSLGRGVAFRIESDILQSLHAQLQRDWLPTLTAQDQQKLRPHITIQNKVEPETAKELKNALELDFAPFTATATGLTLWEYQNGPWQFLKQFNFKATGK